MHTFDTGSFMGEQVYLGELQTDEDGRLIVLGGRGQSASYNGARAMTFANNDGWHDDVSDGPVTAEVVYQGAKLEVDPAWAVVAPPNYAPLLKSVRTMWDLMRDLAITHKLPKVPGGPALQAPARPSFQKDIRPLFERLAHLEWVNAGYAAQFGWKGPMHFTDREWLERLASPSATLEDMRRSLANQFRVFHRDSWSPMPWPLQYGDAMNVPPTHSPRQNAGRQRHSTQDAGAMGCAVTSKRTTSRGSNRRAGSKTCHSPSSRTRSTAPAWSFAWPTPSIQVVK